MTDGIREYFHDAECQLLNEVHIKDAKPKGLKATIVRVGQQTTNVFCVKFDKSALEQHQIDLTCTRYQTPRRCLYF